MIGLLGYFLINLEKIAINVLRFTIIEEKFIKAYLIKKMLENIIRKLFLYMKNSREKKVFNTKKAIKNSKIFELLFLTLKIIILSFIIIYHCYINILLYWKKI